MTFLKKAALIGFAVVAFGLPLKCEALPDVDVLFPSRKTVAEKNSVEMFPPLPKDLQEGCVFDQQKILDRLPQMQNYWYVVPKWIAGEFAYGEMTVDNRHDYKTGKTEDLDNTIPASKSGRARGSFVDKKGNIWQLSRGGTVKIQNSSNKASHRFDCDTQGAIISPGDYMEVSESVDFLVDAASSKITDVTRVLRIRNFFYDDDKKPVDCYLVETRFDQKGHPLTRDKAHGVMKKIHDFEPLTEANERQKGEYAESLAKLRGFMKEEGKAQDAP